MEIKEHEAIKKFLKVNAELKRLYERHRQFEERLSRFKNLKFLTSREELQLKELKKKKLSGVDKMLKIVSTYGYEEAQAA